MLWEKSINADLLSDRMFYVMHLKGKKIGRESFRIRESLVFVVNIINFFKFYQKI